MNYILTGFGVLVALLTSVAESAWTSVGNTANQALSEGGEGATQALSKAESSCKSAVGQLPLDQAQDALSKLCNAIASAE
jgi:hypothetical protein